MTIASTPLPATDLDSNALSSKIVIALRLAFERSIAIAVLLALWGIAPRLGWVNATFLPPFSEVIVVGTKYALDGKLWPHVEVSVVRALGGSRSASSPPCRSASCSAGTGASTAI